MTTRPNPADFDSIDDYCAALSRLKSLTPYEYACVLAHTIALGEEHYGEASAQYSSECAMFGDAGPGQALALQATRRELDADRAKLARVRRIIANLEKTA